MITVAPKLHFFDLSSAIHFAAPLCSKLHLSLVSDLRALVCIGRVSDCTAYNRFHSDLLLSPNQLSTDGVEQHIEMGRQGRASFAPPSHATISCLASAVFPLDRELIEGGGER